MKVDDVVIIQKALHTANVRFILVGGLAVIAHGYLRATRDADIVIELIPDNILRAFKALHSIDYHPTVPVTAEAFADPAQRKHWRETKHMVVLQFWSDAHPETKLDLFLEHPFNFTKEWDQARIDTIYPDAPPLRIASIPTLIAMKRSAGRLRDLDDIQHLEMLSDE